MALIAGSTLSDLSRNSLLEDATRQASTERAFDRARRAYEYGTLSAQDRERTNQLMADNALRREIGLGDIGVRSRDADVREKIGMGEIGVRGRSVDAQNEFWKGQLANQKALLDLQADQFKSGGELRVPALLAANRANALFANERQLAFGELVEMLDKDTWFTGRDTAIKVANDIIAGRPVPSWAEKASQWYNSVRIPSARQKIYEQLGDTSGVITQDETGMYVPVVGRGSSAKVDTQPAPANGLASTPPAVDQTRKTFVRDANGNLVLKGGPALAAAAAQRTAESAPPNVPRVNPGLGAPAWIEAITGYSPSQIGNAALGGLNDISRFWTGYTPSEIGGAAVNNLASGYIGAYDTAAERARSARDSIAGKVRSANPFLPDFWMENNAQPTPSVMPVNWFGMGGY